MSRSDPHNPRTRRFASYESRNHRSGGNLMVPKTPAQSIVLAVKLRKLKLDYLRRHG